MHILDTRELFFGRTVKFVSLIGTLEQFSLSLLLQRVERHEKTGLLVLKQGAQWIEFYLRDGRLLCVGPVRTSASLGERLVQEGIISPAVWRETALFLRNEDLSESRIARTLMEHGLVGREDLRSWTIKNTVSVLRVLFSWSAGEIYFEDGTFPPSDRLLVSMSISSLIESAAPPVAPPAPVPPTPVKSVSPVLAPPVSQTLSGGQISPFAPPSVTKTPASDVARVPTLMSASQFIDDSSFAAPSLNTSFSGQVAQPKPPSQPLVQPQPQIQAQPQVFDDSFLSEEKPDLLFSSSGSLNAAENENAAGMFSASGFIDMESVFADSDESPMFDSFESLASSSDDGQSGFASLFGDDDVDQPVHPSGIVAPEPVMNPVPPQRIDISFMQPDMILWPADLSAYRQEDPFVQITPDQWIILTRVNGQMSLGMICQEMGLSPEFVCQTAGELIAEGLIHISLPSQNPMNEVSPAARELAASGMGNGYIAPGAASAPAPPWSAAVPAPSSPDLSAAANLSFETESQWGNGGNGAVFVPGRGWITESPPMPSSDSYPPQNNSYAQMGLGY